MRKLRLAIITLRQSGLRALWHRTRKYAVKKAYNVKEIRMSVKNEDVLAVDLESFHRRQQHKKLTSGKNLTLNWILPTISAGSGGHNTIFRFVRYLESAGHTCNIFVYDRVEAVSHIEQRKILEQHFAPMKAKLIGAPDKMEEADAIIATSWQTAYVAVNSPLTAKRFYFVQDFEPSFYPVSTESVLVENSYRFGFHGITAGGWLSKKLEEEYEMKSDSFDFGSDATEYAHRNSGERKKVLFYARPVTPRRGFELGAFALQLFEERHPEYELHFVGWDVSGYKLPYKFVNHKIINHKQLAELYNDCAAALVLSLTNMSLLPLELLAAGCIPVVNEGENNRLVSNKEHIVYAAATPAALAEALSDVVTRKDLKNYSKKASQSVASLSWEDSGKKVEAVLKRELGMSK
jgi:glycosyltransferase involved in cell wall biosynthesis